MDEVVEKALLPEREPGAEPKSGDQ
jgi:hypothetical protein